MAARDELLAGLRARAGVPRPPVRRSVWFGATGPDVEHCQARLAVHRIYDVARGDPPGRFGAGTEQAVRAFQRAHDLRADAIVGSATWQALDRDP